MKRVIVTGGAGFIGSHLCEYLVGEGNTVYCMDNLSSGNLSNINHLMGRKNFNFVKCDVTSLLPQVNGHIDEIYYLASPASPKYYKKRPLSTALSNTTGTLNFLRLAKRKKAKFLFASSAEVYGDPEQNPQTEEYNGAFSPLSPRACYAESKRFGETLVQIFRRKYNVDAKIVRIFNTYGPKMRYDDGRVIPTFIWKAIKNESLTIYGNGTQTRSFCYVYDTIRGIVKMINSEYFGPVNLGNPYEEISIIDLANKIKKIVGSKSDIIFLPKRPDDPIKRKPDISKAIKFLGYSPQYNLDIGLKNTVEYFQDLIRYAGEKE